MESVVVSIDVSLRSEKRITVHCVNWDEKHRLQYRFLIRLVNSFETDTNIFIDTIFENN